MGHMRAWAWGLVLVGMSSPGQAQQDSVPSSTSRAPSGVDTDDGRPHAHDLYLEVVRAEHSTGIVIRARERGERLSVSIEDLRAVGVILSSEIASDDEGLIPLDAVPGLAYRYERPTQRLVLEVPPALRPVQRIGYEPPDPVSVRRDPGWLFNYDIHGRTINGVHSGATSGSLRWFGGAGAIEISGVGRIDDRSVHLRRLDTHWSYSDPLRLWTWTAGDLISGGVAWSRPVRMLGLRWQRDFGVRPDLFTLPVSRLSADAVVPSTVELFVNGARHLASEVQDGPFVLDLPPRINGAGQASLVVTDALGRVTEATIPLYVDHQRLGRGLNDFSVEIGFLQRGYSERSNEYGRSPVASASWRHGLRETLTLESHSELASGLRMIGAGLAWSPFNRWGVVTASYAHVGGDTAGGQYSIGYQWFASRYGFDLQTIRREESFRDLGDLNTTRGPIVTSFQTQDRAAFWVSIPRGSLGFAWLRVRQAPGQSQDVRSLSWSQSLGPRISLSTSISRHGRSAYGGGVVISMPFGAGLHAGSGVQFSGEGASSWGGVKRNAPDHGGWGWGVNARPEDRFAQATLEARGRYGETSVDVEAGEGHAGGSFRASGGIAFMEGRIFFSRPIQDAFAIVSTGGIPGVPVLSENRLYGHTNDAGYLLVPRLHGWQRNQLAIDPDELGYEYQIDSVKQIIIPADRGGAIVPFEVIHASPAIVVLLSPDGSPVPAGYRGRRLDTGETFVIGFDGEAYLADTTPQTVIEVDLHGVRCRYPVPAGNANGGPRRGALACERAVP